MATDVRKSVEDAEMAEREEDKVVTMMDVLQEQEDFEEDANAVLGGSDDKNCTYSKGYIKRQALYACMTCCSEAKSDPKQRAGLCLACSLTCHENHELIELYTKRNFRCDCGNSKFKSHPCQLAPNKAKINDENSYNQNFSGLYCVCQKPYPDNESVEEDVMIQCTICEDWYHTSHLDTTVPATDLYSEMICKGCMEKNDFFNSYSHLIVNVENIDVDVVNVPENDNKTVKTCNGDIKTDEKFLTCDNKNSHIDDVDVTEKTENTTTEASNINGIEKSNLKNDMENASNETSKESEKETPVSTIGTDSMEKLPNESRESNSEVITENENNQSNLDNSTKQNSSDDQTNLEQSKNITNPLTDVTSDKKETNTENREKNVTETANMLTEQDEERMEEDRLLADTESEDSSSKPNSNDAKTGDEHNNENKQDSNSVSTLNDKGNSAKIENEAAQGSADAEKNIESRIDENRDLKEASMENVNKKEDTKEASNTEQCSPDNSLCKELSSNNKISEKRKLSTEGSSNIVVAKKTKLDEVSNKACIRPKGVTKNHRGATFWPSSFRQKLCTCTECLSMYKDLSLLYLIDADDTVMAYESLGKEKTNGKPSQYEKGLQALSSLDRIQQINALTEYNKMRDKLLDFLKSFKDRREVVKEEDIKAFFAGMKPTREPDGVYFCR